MLGKDIDVPKADYSGGKSNTVLNKSLSLVYTPSQFSASPRSVVGIKKEGHLYHPQLHEHESATIGSHLGCHRGQEPAKNQPIVRSEE